MLMKRLFLLASIVLLSLSTAAMAQISWGVSAGVNVTGSSNVSVKSFDFESGWYAGLTAKVTIPILGFGVDGAVLYSNETACLEKETTEGGKESEASRFVSVPIHLRYDFQLPLVSKVVVPFAMVGPQFNLGLNDVTFDNLTDYEDETIIDKSNSWRLDMGIGAILLSHLQVSYSYAIPMGKTSKFYDGAKQVWNNYKTGTHRIGVVYYF